MIGRGFGLRGVIGEQVNFESMLDQGLVDKQKGIVTRMQDKRCYSWVFEPRTVAFAAIES